MLGTCLQIERSHTQLASSTPEPDSNDDEIDHPQITQYVSLKTKSIPFHKQYDFQNQYLFYYYKIDYFF